MNVRLPWVVAGAFVLAVILSVLIFGGKNTATEDIRAAYLPGGEFTLSHGGERFDMRGLRGAPYILYFGFTHCPDVCPLGLATIRDALQQDEALSDVKALFVSVDPERDTAERVASYAAFFHPNILGKTGTKEEITKLAKAYGTYFMAGAKDANGGYSVDHTAYYYLLDRDGELVRVLDHNVTALTIAEELQKLL